MYDGLSSFRDDTNYYINIMSSPGCCASHQHHNISVLITTILDQNSASKLMKILKMLWCWINSLFGTWILTFFSCSEQWFEGRMPDKREDSWLHLIDQCDRDRVTNTTHWLGEFDARLWRILSLKCDKLNPSQKKRWGRFRQVNFNW